MRSFEEEVVERKVLVHTSTSKTDAIKIRMTETLLITRPNVRLAVRKWLLSFSSPMSKQELLIQLRKLSPDDATALEQLELSSGIRVLEGLPSPEYPLLEISLEEAVQDTRVIALDGGKRARDRVIQFADENELKILDIDMLITQCPTANVKGRVPQIIQSASETEILPIIGLEKNKSLNTYLKSTLDSLFQVRSDDKNKRTVVSWTSKNSNQTPIIIQVSKIFKV